MQLGGGIRCSFRFLQDLSHNRSSRHLALPLPRQVTQRMSLDSDPTSGKHLCIGAFTTSRLAPAHPFPKISVSLLGPIKAFSKPYTCRQVLAIAVWKS
eukprot:6113134-Amphidinium_carterae.1